MLSPYLKMFAALLLVIFGSTSLYLHAQGKPPIPKQLKCRVLGLFMPERERDLIDLLEKTGKFKLIALDFAKAELTVEFDSAQVWSGEKPNRYLELFNNELRNGSRGSFSAKELIQTPADKLRWVEITVEGLDCKGCSFGAYRLIYELPGVELATSNFKTGLIRAYIDPEKTSRAKLEEALKKGGVDILPQKQ